MPPEQAEAVAETPAAVESVEQPAVVAAVEAAEAAEAQATESAAETPAEGAEAAGEAAEAQGEAEQPAPPKKSPVAQLQGRVGHLTKTIHQKDEEIAERDRRLAAYQALLEGTGVTPPDGGQPAPTAPVANAPVPGTPEFQQLVTVEAQRIAALERFNADCNKVFEQGEKAHGTEFGEAIANLNALGLMNETVVQAALATDAPADVLHFLGSDVDEAARITALPPVKMGAELTKLATKLSSAANPGVQVSKAPPPIKPMGSTASAEVDISDPSLSMAEYARRRAAQGAPYARAPKQ